MPLNISQAFRAKNNVLRGLLTEFTTLRFIGVNKMGDKSRFYLGSIEEGWFYSQRKDPSTGSVVEVIYFTSSNAAQDVWADKCSFVELARPDGSFLRGQTGVKLKPFPPSYQWEILFTPNDQDKDMIW